MRRLPLPWLQLNGGTGTESTRIMVKFKVTFSLIMFFSASPEIEGHPSHFYHHLLCDRITTLPPTHTHTHTHQPPELIELLMQVWMRTTFK